MEATEREVWQEPDYRGMIPKLENAHIEIEQLRFKIQESGGLIFKDPVKLHDDSTAYMVEERERRALLGMLIQEGNKRLQELSEVKSYLEAVDLEGMKKVSSGYVLASKQNFAEKKENKMSYIWSPSGIKADHFIMEGDLKDGVYTLERNHDEIEDSMLLSIDFDELEELFSKGEIPYL